MRIICTKIPTNQVTCCGEYYIILFQCRGKQWQDTTVLINALIKYLVGVACNSINIFLNPSNIFD